MKLNTVLNNDDNYNIDIKSKFDLYNIEVYAFNNKELFYKYYVPGLKDKINNFLKNDYKVEVESNIIEELNEFSNIRTLYNRDIYFEITVSKDDHIVIFNNHGYSELHNLNIVLINLLLDIFNIIKTHYELSEEQSSTIKSLNDVSTMFSQIHNIDDHQYTNVELIDGSKCFIDENGNFITIDEESIDVNKIIEQQREYKQEQERLRIEQENRQTELNRQQIEQEENELQQRINQLSEEEINSIRTIINALNHEMSNQNVLLHATNLGYL